MGITQIGIFILFIGVCVAIISALIYCTRELYEWIKYRLSDIPVGAIVVFILLFGLLFIVVGQYIS